MGCGGIRQTNNQVIKDAELYKESFKDLLKKAKGLKIDDKNIISNFKVLNPNNPIFSEELVDHADESGSVKPWISNIVPPEIEIVEDKASPCVKVKIDHVFGFRSYDVRQNLFFTDNKNICYMNGAVGIVQNIDNLTQKIFGGLESNDVGDCHDDDIVSIAFHKGEVSMIATGQRHMKPMIMIWSPLDPTVIYSKFHQTKGTIEVSKLAFDKKGENIASVGGDPLHSFFVFNLESKALIWKGTIGDNFIFDLQFNPLGDEFCIVGNKTVNFLYLSRKMKKDALPKNPKYINLTFTAVCYTKDGHPITSAANGSILIWEDCIVIKEVSISTTTLQNIMYSNVTNKIYISDSNKFVFVANFKKDMFVNCEIIEKFNMSSTVKALDVNENGELALGLQDGTIIIKNKQSEKIVTKSHFDGSVLGLIFIPDFYILTTGGDNRIMLWNINTFICEEIGTLNEKSDIIIKTNSDNNNFQNQLNDNQCSQCVSYNKKFQHVAIGLNNGFISIRNDIRKLDERIIQDLFISKKEILELKYSPNMKLLAAASAGLEFFIMNVESLYLIITKLKGHEDYVIQFDWDVTSRYLQAVTNDNYYIFYDKETEENVKDPMELRNVSWSTLTCKFGYYVQGIFMGSTDPHYINSVACSNLKRFIASGDDDNFLNIYNFPCIRDNPKWKSYYGHSDHVAKVVFNHLDNKIISIAGQDKSIIVWSITYDK